MNCRPSYVILLFHSVDDRKRLSLQNSGNVRPDFFEKICGSIKQEFDVISLKELVGLVSEGREPAGRFLSLTFDDGPKSYSSVAVPVMAARGIPSACFIITDFIESNAPYWRYLYNYCKNAGYGGKLAGLISSEYGVQLKEEDIISFTRRHYGVEKNKRIMEGIARSIVGVKEYTAREKDLFLSFDDIEALKEDPLVAFGIHTRTHPVMSGLNGAEIADEISGCIAFYRARISDDVPMFSVPFGRLGRDYDEGTVLAALELGIPAVFSAYGGLNAKDQPLYNLRRIPVTEKLLERGTGAFVRSLIDASVAPEYIEMEKSLRDAVERWRKRGVSARKT